MGIFEHGKHALGLSAWALAVAVALAPIPTDPYQFVNPSGFEQRKFQLGFKVRF